MLATELVQAGAITVLIGPNGAGKSRLLRALCDRSLRLGEDVIAIAPTIFDRFRKMPTRGLRFFGARQGRAAASKVVGAALARASSENPQVLKNLLIALEFTGFDPYIGIGLSNVNLDNLPRLEQLITSDAMDSEERQKKLNDAYELRGALMKWQGRDAQERVVRLTMNAFTFDELDALSFAVVTRFEKLLQRADITSRISYFLYRDGKRIDLLDACSGEISFITSIAFISSQIKHRSVIAIDEPETSLHPTWQQQYLPTLLDLFHQYEPRIVISTHSPIIISGAEVKDGNVNVIEVLKGKTRLFDHKLLSLEEMYDQIFGLITPKNHYLSQRAVSLLNALNDGDQTIESVLNEFAELRRKSYDESQKEIIEKFENIARDIEKIKRETAT